MRVPTAITAVLEYDSIARRPKILLVGEAPPRYANAGGLDSALVFKSVSMSHPWVASRLRARERAWAIAFCGLTQDANLLEEMAR